MHNTVYSHTHNSLQVHTLLFINTQTVVYKHTHHCLRAYTKTHTHYCLQTHNCFTQMLFYPIHRETARQEGQGCEGVFRFVWRGFSEGCFRDNGKGLPSNSAQIMTIVLQIHGNLPLTAKHVCVRVCLCVWVCACVCVWVGTGYTYYEKLLLCVFETQHAANRVVL